MLGPRQVVPTPLGAIPSAPGPSPTTRTFVATDASSLKANLHADVRPGSAPRDCLDPKAFKAQNPGTLSMRSHVLSLLVTTRRGHHCGFRCQWVCTDSVPT